MSATGLICPKCNGRYGAHLTECPQDNTPLADARVADALINRSLGNFQVERLLGAGGMGMIFAARHKTIGTQAVVKVLSPEMLRIRDAKTRFLNEAKLASAVNHPNIVRIFDFGETFDQLVYMIMEYIPGEDLDSILRTETKLPPLRAAKIMRQVSSALDAAHTAPNGPVIHRDLKPSNIRVSRRGRDEHATVLDFGIAKATEQPGQERLTVAGMVIGTPRYMAPEQACGDPVDPRTDVYALGVIAYELVSGNTPYQTSRLVELITRQLHMPIPALDPKLDVPKAYGEIVLRCLDKDPQKRFQSAGELYEALDRYIQEEAATVIRRRATIGIGAALALGAVVAGAVWILRPAGGTTQVLELRALTASGRDVAGAQTIYVKGPSVALAGEIRGLPAIAELRPEVSVTLDDKPVAKVETRADGFAAEIDPLPPGRSVAAVAVTYGEADKRTTVEVLRRPIVRDAKAPAIALRDGATYRRRPAGNAVVCRAPAARLDIAIEEEGALHPDAPLSVRADPPLKASVQSVAYGAAAVDLDLSQMRPNESALLVVKAQDAAENEAELRLVAIYDPTPPALQLLEVRDAVPPAEPGGPYRVQAGSGGFPPLPREIVATFRIAEIVARAGLAAKVVEEPAPGAASANVNPAVLPEVKFILREEGGYRFSVSIEDEAGNSTATAIAFAVEVPLATDIPAPPAATAAKEVTIAGLANKPLRSAAGRSITKAGERVEAAGTIDGARFSVAIPLAPRAEQTIELTLTPERGEPALRRFTIVHDDEPPVVAIVEPAPWPDLFAGKNLDGGAIRFVRKVEDRLSGIARETVRAFGFKAEDEAGAAAGAIEAAGLGAAALSGVELPVVPGEAGAARVRASDPFIAIAIEAEDRAGNRRTIVRRAHVQGNPPAVTAVPTHKSVRLHERIDLQIELDRPVRKLTVNGSDESVKRISETRYAYSTTMFLDSDGSFEVVAEDEAGNPGRASVRVLRIDRCLKPTAQEGDEPEAVDVAAQWKARKDNPQATRCGICGRPIFSGKENP